MTAEVTAPASAATRMGRRLTVPFERGAGTMELPLALYGSSQVTVVAYDFADQVARFGAPPEPRYVLTAAQDIPVDTTVTVSFEEPETGGEEQLLRVGVPAGTVAGTSFLLEKPVTATARVFMLTMAPTPPGNDPQNWWTLTVLLGNLAKLLWVTGAEREQLRRHAGFTLAQRHLPSAVGLSLDLIGADLGVPRFPPLPHGFDARTVALYHLDDAAEAVSAAEVTAAYPGRTGHPGTLEGPVQLGVTGRYGRAMGFRAPEAFVDVTTSTAFDIGEHDGATIECFVRPDQVPPRTPDGPVLSRHPDPEGGEGPGWVLSVGTFGRGVAGSLSFTISDGDTTVRLFADTTLPTDAFTHVAAVVDRITGRVGLYLDGQLRDWRFLYPLGAVANTAPLRIGAAGGSFRGVVDEVRISSVARASFAPALGEDDDHYRKRLELFRRWTLPTPANLTTLLNRLAGPIGGDEASDALVVDDRNAPLVRGTRLVHVRPRALLPGESIDAAGRRRSPEASVVGTAGQESAFDPAYLLRYDRADVDFTPAPAGSGPADPHLVQVGVAERLDALVTLAGAETVPPGRLLVDAGYDPGADDLRATGRAVLLGHSSVAPGRLAALAHRAGFDYVGYRTADGAGKVYAAAALEDYFRIDLTPADPDPTVTAQADPDPTVTAQADVGPNVTARTVTAPADLTPAAPDPADLIPGIPVTLSLRPAPPADAFLRWLVVPGGAGRGTLTPESGPGSRHRTASLLPTAPGQLIVKADVTRGRHAVPVSATHALRVGLPGLDDGATVTADGTPGLPASGVDRPGTYFDAAFLVFHDDPRVDYGGHDAHLMQPAVAELLDALLAELARRSVTGRLAVPAGYAATSDPPDLAVKEGRRLVLRHGSLDAGALAKVAFAVGFAHLTRHGDDLEVRQTPGQLVEVRGPAGVDGGAVIELDEGTTMDLTATPTAETLAAAGLTGQVPDEGPRLSWASGTYDTAAITVGSSTRQTVTLRADAAGMAWVQASYLIGAEPVPYTFQVRLRPELDTPATVITKDQHDLIMNVLNVLHPVGVEVNTAAVRAHVIEVQGDLAQANPDYTYPKFRVRSTLPRQVRRPADG
ncbi:LamG-like jellyroll fold domain-containing protein [Streptomyces sp. NPDC058457]|uniref:LamG-like jellyroll fold domain-containing protein n=1 Tax=Streptomyces sp. NPDC058457 TaxID=3346507 RepID=UPI00364C3FB8